MHSGFHLGHFVCVCVVLLSCLVAPRIGAPLPLDTFTIVLPPSPCLHWEKTFVSPSFLFFILSTRSLLYIPSDVRFSGSCSCGVPDSTHRTKWTSFPFSCLLETSSFSTPSYGVRLKVYRQSYCVISKTWLSIRKIFWLRVLPGKQRRIRATHQTTQTKLARPASNRYTASHDDLDDRRE